MTNNVHCDKEKSVGGIKMPNITNFNFVNRDSREIITMLEVDNIPGRTTFTVEFSLVLDVLKDFKGYVSLRRSDNTVIVDTNPFEISKSDFISEEEEKKIREKGSNMVTGVTLGVLFEDVFFEKPDVYTTILILDEQTLGEFAIPVIPRKE